MRVRGGGGRCQLELCPHPFGDRFRHLPPPCLIPVSSTPVPPAAAAATTSACAAVPSPDAAPAPVSSRRSSRSWSCLGTFGGFTGRLLGSLDSVWGGFAAESTDSAVAMGLAPGGLLALTCTRPVRHKVSDKLLWSDVVLSPGTAGIGHSRPARGGEDLWRPLWIRAVAGGVVR